MVSNGYSKRRGPLRRPKVCTASPNPGRCHPPPPPPPSYCFLVPPEQTITLHETAIVEIHCCKGYLPYLDPVDITLDADEPDWIDLGTTSNCSTGEIEFLPERPHVTSTVQVTIEFSDSSTCLLTAIVHVTPN